MIFDRSDSEEVDWEGFPEFADIRVPKDRDGLVLNSSEDDNGFEFPAEQVQRRSYDRELVDSVWEFAEVVRGNDAALWRKDEFGHWICRRDFGRRDSEFGWEIFDPGVGRHTQGVYAMRPMQWQSFARQYDTLG